MIRMKYTYFFCIKIGSIAVSSDLNDANLESLHNNPSFGSGTGESGGGRGGDV